MFNIRYNLFETNSSSVHALVIPKKNPVKIPKHVTLTGGYYGWEDEECWDTINYFYQATEYFPEKRARLLKFLKSLNITVKEVKQDEDGWYGVDHSGEVPFDELFKDKELLTKFLFGTKSYVKLGNDNEECEYPEENDDVTILWKYN